MVMSMSYGTLRGYNLYIIEPWEGMTWWFLLLPGVDSRCLRGMARSYDTALEIARQAMVAEVQNEQNSRGRR